MMKKVPLLLSMLVWVIIMNAQNQFVYVRYNPRHGNASTIVRTIDNILQESQGQVVVFISRADSPLLASNIEEWEENRTSLLGMQTAYEYYAEDELIVLNEYFTELFSEFVDMNLHLMGKNDKSWICTFIISEKMFHEEFEFLAESISINELVSRMPVNVLTYSDAPQLLTMEAVSNRMFNFNISE